MRDLAPDTVVDQRYSIVRRIGSGGMADVYCAQDLQLGRKVALKLLYRRFAEDEEFVERFKREASSAAGLQHPHVVGVYDRGEWDGTYYIAMEYLEGRSLKQILQEEGPLAPERAVDVVLQILQAARFAHQRGIVHRDIKPHNVILDDEGRAKVTDFGIARAGASDMTETGSIMGTAQYLSPEQAQGHAVGPRSDLYAIGIVLYELLCGRVPFDGDSPVTIALKQVSELPIPPSAYNPVIPPELDAIVLHALEKEPERRFANADEFAAALQEARATMVAVPAGQATAVFGAIAAADPTAPAALAGPPLPPAPTQEELAAMTYPPEPLPPEDEEERRRLARTMAGRLPPPAAGDDTALLARFDAELTRVQALVRHLHE
ncbi:MAG: protein kinase, partial [Actinomycetota bacterium]|nr:protein kinase [Actinomycetota bacterium]